MFEIVKEILATFEPITLEELGEASLMERMDTKFVFPLLDLPAILGELQPHYRALEVAGSRLGRYETLYYDTADLQLYQRHLTGRSNRFKVRSRRYVDSDVCFFEIKHRTNKGRTIKNRIRTHAIENHISDTSARFLGELTNLDPRQLQGTIWVNYWRATLVSKTSKERLTLDLGLNYRTATRNIDFGRIAIAEVKRLSPNSRSPVISVFNRHRIRAGAISKYCLGLVSTQESLRKNNFQEQIRRLLRTSDAA